MLWVQTESPPWPRDGESSSRPKPSTHRRISTPVQAGNRHLIGVTRGRDGADHQGLDRSPSPRASVVTGPSRKALSRPLAVALVEIGRRCLSIPKGAHFQSPITCNRADRLKAGKSLQTGSTRAVRGGELYKSGGNQNRLNQRAGAESEVKIGARAGLEELRLGVRRPVDQRPIRLDAAVSVPDPVPGQGVAPKPGLQRPAGDRDVDDGRERGVDGPAPASSETTRTSCSTLGGRGADSATPRGRRRRRATRRPRFERGGSRVDGRPPSLESGGIPTRPWVR